MRKGHFLGAKLRALRKRNGLTLEELSVRCIQRDAAIAPSGVLPQHDRERQAQALRGAAGAAGGGVPARRRPGSSMRAPTWSCRAERAPASGGAARVPLEPAFLFSKTLLQAAIPELLAQTGTSGRQFAHLLIRSHQEMSRNDFPDLERAADSVGERRFPLSVDDLHAPLPSGTGSRSAGSIASPCSRATRTARCAAWCARSSSRRASSTPTARCRRTRRA